ncbi:hypothetical protein [Haloferula sargassicola]|uniref:hypothetical protein n=1 Tax=Haloferula sargassicola TaxID=490096 RepID=UPI003365A904
MKLHLTDLHGRWRIVGSEIENVSDGDEEYEFIEPNILLMSYRQDDGRMSVHKLRFKIVDDGFVVGTRENLNAHVTAWIESGYLIFRPPHGMETWSERVPE